MGRYSNAVLFEETFPISALHGEGLEEVLDAVAATLPEGPQYFLKICIRTSRNASWRVKSFERS